MLFQNATMMTRKSYLPKSIDTIVIKGNVGEICLIRMSLLCE